MYFLWVSQYFSGSGYLWISTPVGLQYDVLWVSTFMGNQDSLLVRALDSWLKSCKFEFWQEGLENFLFSRVNFVCWLLFGVRSTPVLLQWHVKDLGHSAQSVGGRLHLNTHTSLTQPSRNGLAMPLFRHSVGTYLETSSRATCQGTFGHGRLSLMSHCGLILA